MIGTYGASAPREKQAADTRAARLAEKRAELAARLERMATK